MNNKKIIVISFLFAIILGTFIGSAGFLLNKKSYAYIPDNNKVIVLYNEYDKNLEELDLSKFKIDSVDEWINDIEMFDNLKKVALGNNIIPIDDKLRFKEKYPNITLDAIARINMYGKDILDNAEKIDLSNVNIDSQITEYLYLFSSLKEVDMGGTNLSNAEKRELQIQFSHLIFNWQVDLLSEKYESNIKELNISGKNNIDILELKDSLFLLPNLERLVANNTNLSNEELQSIRNDFPKIKVIWTIRLGNWEIPTDIVAFSTAKLNVGSNPLTSKDIDVLKYCTDLKALDLGHNRITDISVIGEYLTDLRILILADNKIKDISPLSKLKNLHYLELFMNNITDFSVLSELKGLVDVNLCYNTVSDVTPLLNLPKLERLWIVGCSIDKEVVNLKSKYPNAVIVNQGYGSTDSGWRNHERFSAYRDMFKKQNYISELFTKYDE